MRLSALRVSVHEKGYLPAGDGGRVGGVHARRTLAWEAGVEVHSLLCCQVHVLATLTSHRSSAGTGIMSTS